MINEKVAYCPRCGYSQGEIFPYPGISVRSQNLPKFCHGDDIQHVGRCDACGQAMDWSEL